MINLLNFNPIDTLKLRAIPSSNFIYKFSLIIFLIFFIIGFKSNDWPIVIKLIPIYSSLLFLGLSHGAADHLCMWGFLNKQSIKNKFFLISLYFLISIAYLFFWFINPFFAMIFFLLITIYHWGRADYFTSTQLNKISFLRERKLFAFTYSFFRGSFPILLPIYNHPDIYFSFIKTLSFNSNISTIDIITSYSVYLVLIPILIFIFHTLTVLFTVKKTSKNLRNIIYDLIESIFLLIWFLVIPVLWAIGIYFIFWHSFRHAIRLMASDIKGSDYINRLSLIGIFKRWIEMTGLVNLIALIGIIFIVSINFSIDQNSFSILSRMMIGISILTLPHCILIEIMDQKFIKKVVAEEGLEPPTRGL